MRTSTRQAAAVLAALSLLATACASDGPVQAAGDTDGSASPSASSVPGSAGATFVNPVFTDWIYEYSSPQNAAALNPGASINYQSIGSGGGIEQFLLETVDFGASERYLRDDTLAEAEEARGCPAIQFPIVFGSVTIAFHDEALDGLILDGTTIADIFERRITRYDDPQIAALNPGRDLPDADIIPVHRSDGSGTTSVFTTYLDQDDSVEGWTLGNGTEVQWPAGTIGGQGNEGVAAAIQQNPGGLGYLNQAYVLEQDFPQAQIINADGTPVTATLEATTAGAEVADIPDDFQFDILDIGGEGFPITGTAWVFAWECGYDDATAALLKDFWTYALSDEGAAIAEELGYAPVGAGLRDRVLAAVDRINAQG
jgi:phosphate transport system substrate-binding protein